MSSRDEVVYCVQFDSVSVEICFTTILSGLKVHASYRIQQFNCETNISSLGFTSSQLLSLAWHKHSILKPITGCALTRFHSGAVYSSSFWCPHLLSTPTLATCFSEGAPDGFSWTAGLLMGCIWIGVFLSPHTESSAMDGLWWMTPESYQLLNWIVANLLCSSARY